MPKNDRLPIVFVPGFMGSTLATRAQRDRGHSAWPPVPPPFAASGLGRSDLEVGGLVTRTALGPGPGAPAIETYGAWIDEVVLGELGYRRDLDFFVFTWDWRGSAQAAAERLVERMEAWADVVRGDRPDRPGAPQFVLVGHSTGAAVCRCYVDHARTAEHRARVEVAHTLLFGATDRGIPMVLQLLKAGSLLFPGDQGGRTMLLGANLLVGGVAKLARAVAAPWESLPVGPPLLVAEVQRKRWYTARRGRSAGRRVQSERTDTVQVRRVDPIRERGWLPKDLAAPADAPPARRAEARRIEGLMEQGRALAESLEAPPTAPTTYLVGVGHLTRAEYRVVDREVGDPATEADVRGEVHWPSLHPNLGSGDGVVPASFARAPDPRSGLAVEWASGRLSEHIDLYRHPRARALLIRLTERVGPEDDLDPATRRALRRSWRGAERHERFLAAGAAGDLPLFEPGGDLAFPSPTLHGVIANAQGGSPDLRRGDLVVVLGRPPSVCPFDAAVHALARTRRPGDATLLWAAAPASADSDALVAALAAQHALSEDAIVDLLERRPSRVLLGDMDRLLAAEPGRRALQDLRARFPRAAVVAFAPHRSGAGAQAAADARVFAFERCRRTLRCVLAVDGAFDGPQVLARLGAYLDPDREDPTPDPVAGGLSRSVDVEVRRPVDRETGGLAGAVADRVVDVDLAVSGFGSTPGRQSLRPFEGARASDGRAWEAVDLGAGLPGERALTATFRLGAQVVATVELEVSPRLHDDGVGALLDRLAQHRIVVALRDAGLDDAEALQGLAAEAGRASSGDLIGDLAALNRAEPDAGGTPLGRWLVAAARLAAPLDPDAARRIAAEAGAAGGLFGDASVAVRVTELDEVEVGADDLVPVRFLEDGLAAARGVCRLDVPIVRDGAITDAPRASGTGWSIAPRLVLTALHVLIARRRGDAIGADFGPQVAATTAVFEQDAAATPIALERVLVRDAELDFAIVELAAPHAPVLRVSRKSAGGGASVGRFANILQHPGGGAAQVALRENRLTAAEGSRLEYVADTAKGSSGAPVFDDDFEVVGTHRKFELRSRRRGRLGGDLRRNVATSMPAILARIAELAAGDPTAADAMERVRVAQGWSDWPG